MTQNTRLEDIRRFIQERFASEAGLAVADVIAGHLTLSDVLRRSPKIVNSVDLMECFARTANALRRDFDIRVRLPAYPVNTTLKTIVDAFIQQVESQIRPGGEASC